MFVLLGLDDATAKRDTPQPRAKAVMTKLQIENKMSIGNILNLLALVVAVAVGWGVMSERGSGTESHKAGTFW